MLRLRFGAYGLFTFLVLGQYGLLLYLQWVHVHGGLFNYVGANYLINVVFMLDHYVELFNYVHVLHWVHVYGST
jgi:hypothetical protein